MQDRSDAGQDRTGRVKDRADEGQGGCRTGRMQYRTDAGKEDAGQEDAG